MPHFNELRQDIVLLYELKLALANCEYELQTLRHRFDTLAPGKVRPSTVSTLNILFLNFVTWGEWCSFVVLIVMAVI